MSVSHHELEYRIWCEYQYALPIHSLALQYTKIYIVVSYTSKFGRKKNLTSVH